MTTDVASKPVSFWEDLVDIFVAPAQVFARRAGKGFALALLVVTVVMGGLFIGTKPLLRPVMDVVWSQQEAALRRSRPELTADQLAGARATQEKLAPIVTFIVIPITILLVGLILWLVGKLFDGREGLGDACMIATYAYFPKILAMVATAVMASLMDPARIISQYSPTLGLGFFLGTGSSPVLGALLGRVDVFTIWVTVLIGVGLHVVGRVAKSQAAIAAVLVWIIGALPGILQALRTG